MAQLLRVTNIDSGKSEWINLAHLVSFREEKLGTRINLTTNSIIARETTAEIEQELRNASAWRS